MTHATVTAAINRHRNARSLVGLANQKVIKRGDAVGEMSKARARLRAVTRELETMLGREHRV